MAVHLGNSSATCASERKCPWREKRKRRGYLKVLPPLRRSAEARVRDAPITSGTLVGEREQQSWEVFKGGQGQGLDCIDRVLGKKGGGAKAEVQALCM